MPIKIIMHSVKYMYFAPVFFIQQVVRTTFDEHWLIRCGR